MKKLLITSICVALLVLSGCKSTPEETVEPDGIQPTETFDSLAEANEALKGDIEKAREMAIAAGAEQYFADELMVVDVASTEAHSVYANGGDEQAFNDTATDILYQYRAIEQVSLATKAKMKIDDLGFESYDPESYAEGMAAMASTDELFNSGADGMTLYNEAKKAADAYELVLFTAFSALADEEREKFLAVKAQADDIKAGVADAENYNNSVVFFTQGDGDLASDNPESALENFTTATTSMTTVYEDVAEKRRLAQEAMDRARRRIEEAEEVATVADTIVPLSDVEALDEISEEETEGGE